MKNLFCAIFILMTLNVNAQFAYLMNDKNVAWVAESSIDIRLDMVPENVKAFISEETKYDLKGILNILKLQGENEFYGEEGYWFFTHLLIAAAARKEITVYSDSLCRNSIEFLTAMEGTKDTTPMIDPTTYETKYIVQMCPQHIQEVSIFRVHQVIYYNSTNNKWGIRVLSIAPLKANHTKEGKFIGWRPLFWVKVEHKKADLNSPDITWSVRTQLEERENTIQLDSLKEHKKTNAKMPILHFLNAAQNNEKLALYDGLYKCINKIPISIDERKRIFEPMDTLHPTGTVFYDTNNKIVVNDFKAQDVKKIKITQEWAWDKKRKILLVNYIGFVLLQNVKDDVGELRWCKRLFYQRFDD